MGRVKLALLGLVTVAAAVATLTSSAASAPTFGAAADLGVPREPIGAGGGPALPPPASLGPGGAGKGKVTGVTSSGKNVVVKVRCAGVSGVRCALVLMLSAQRGGRRVTIGRATLTLAGGAHRVVALGLNGTGRRLLAAAHKLPARLTVTQGKKVLTTRSLTLTAKP